MPDESLKTYQEVMNYLKSKKKRKIHLLFGNGFSMGYDPQIFSYNALSEFVKKCKVEFLRGWNYSNGSMPDPTI